MAAADVSDVQWAKGLLVSVTGFTKEARVQVQQAIERSGGRYSPSLSSRCTHLVVASSPQGPPSQKLAHALRNKHKWGTHIVDAGWLDASVCSGSRAEEQQHAPQSLQDHGAGQLARQAVVALAALQPVDLNAAAPAQLDGANGKPVPQTAPPPPSPQRQRKRATDYGVTQLPQRATDADLRPQLAKATGLPGLLPPPQARTSSGAGRCAWKQGLGGDCDGGGLWKQPSTSTLQQQPPAADYLRGGAAGAQRGDWLLGADWGVQTDGAQECSGGGRCPGLPPAFDQSSQAVHALAELLLQQQLELRPPAQTRVTAPLDATMPAAAARGAVRPPAVAPAMPRQHNGFAVEPKSEVRGAAAALLLQARSPVGGAPSSFTHVSASSAGSGARSAWSVRDRREPLSYSGDPVPQQAPALAPPQRAWSIEELAAALRAASNSGLPPPAASASGAAGSAAQRGAAHVSQAALGASHAVQASAQQGPGAAAALHATQGTPAALRSACGTSAPQPLATGGAGAGSQHAAVQEAAGSRHAGAAAPSWERQLHTQEPGTSSDATGRTASVSQPQHTHGERPPWPAATPGADKDGGAAHDAALQQQSLPPPPLLPSQQAVQRCGSGGMPGSAAAPCGGEAGSGASGASSPSDCMSVAETRGSSAGVGPTLSPAYSCVGSCGGAGGRPGSPAPVFAGVVAVLDPDLPRDDAARVREALLQGGGAEAAVGAARRSATHVVCAPEAAMRWLALGVDVVSPQWVLASKRSGRLQRCIAVSMDTTKHLPSASSDAAPPATLAQEEPRLQAGSVSGAAHTARSGSGSRMGSKEERERLLADAQARMREGAPWSHPTATPTLLLQGVLWSVTDPPHAAMMEPPAPSTAAACIDDEVIADSEADSDDDEAGANAAAAAATRFREVPATQAVAEQVLAGSGSGSGAGSGGGLGVPLGEELLAQVVYKAPSLTLLLPQDGGGELGHASVTLPVFGPGLTMHQLLDAIHKFYAELLPVEAQAELLQRGTHCAAALQGSFVEGREVARGVLLGSCTNLEGVVRTSRDLRGKIYDVQLGC